MITATHRGAFRTMVFRCPSKNSSYATASLQTTGPQAPGLSPHERIERILRDDVLAARKRYMNGADSSDEFARVLKRFSEFVIDGTVPEDLKPC
jgi:hypothetical protein